MLVLMPSCVCIQLQEIVEFVVEYLAIQSICSYAFHRKFRHTIRSNPFGGGGHWENNNPLPCQFPMKAGVFWYIRKTHILIFTKKYKALMSIDVLHCSDVCLSVCYLLWSVHLCPVSFFFNLSTRNFKLIHIAIYKKYNDKSMKRSRLIDWLII